MADEFDFNTFIRDAATKLGSPDPGVVANEVLATLPKRHYADAVRRMLRDYVRHVMADMRSREEDEAASTTAGIKQPGTSRFKQSWSGELARPIEVDGEWKFLGDCTFEDLVAAAQFRRELAKANEAEADRLEHLASLLQKNRAKTVGELPAGVVETA